MPYVRSPELWVRGCPPPSDLTSDGKIWNYRGRVIPPVDRQTENITFPHTLCGQ